jgi:hypothetical protein
MSEIKYLAGLRKSIKKDNSLLHRVAINIFGALSEFVRKVDFDNGVFLPLKAYTNYNNAPVHSQNLLANF